MKGKSSGQVVLMAPDPADRISVVVPYYNQARFLAEALESVFAQTCKAFEIIVADDGSTDGGTEMVSRFPDVHCVRQPNQGPSAARNLGLRHSRGSYLVFLDADDRLLPQALATGLDCLKAHPECAFVWGQCRHIAEDGSPLPARPKPCVDHDHYKVLLANNYIRTPAAVMYRRSAVELANGFNPALWGGEDYDLHLRLARSLPIYGHDLEVAEYRVYGASAMSGSAKMLRHTVNALRLQWDYVKEHPAYVEAYHTGMRAWQRLFGERLITEVRSQLRQPRHWRSAGRGLATLARYYPLGVLRYALATARRGLLR